MSEPISQLLTVKNYEWWQVKGLLIGLAIIIATVATVHSIISCLTITLIIFSSLAFIWIVFWVYKNRIRKTRKNAVGILLCIHSADPNVDKRIREDFISSLRTSLSESNIGNFADIYIIPYHIASRYSRAEDAESLLIKAKSHYLIYGLVRKRGQRHILDLTARVRHARLKSDSQQQFAKDMSSAWVSRYNLDHAEEKIELFEISSNIISLCSRYIIGLAALSSYDYSTSEKLFVGVRNEIKSNKYPNIPALITIRKSITHKINQMYMTQAAIFLSIWNDTKEHENIVIANEILKKVYGAYERDGRYLTLRAITEVLLSKDYSKASSFLNKIKPSKRDTIWFLNAGFLNACNNNEKNAVQHYMKAKDINEAVAKPLTLDKITEFEEFIVLYRDLVNPSPMLDYLLAFINDYFKGDSMQAMIDYQLFVNNPLSKQYNTTMKSATKRMAEI